MINPDKNAPEFSSAPLQVIVLLLLFSTTATAEPTSNELLQNPNQAGYIVYLRHAATDYHKCEDSLNTYAGQRNLPAEERKQAEDIGKSIRKPGIPVGKVFSSQCVAAWTPRNWHWAGSR